MRSQINRLSPIARDLFEQLLQAPAYTMGEMGMTPGQARVAVPELERRGLALVSPDGRATLKIDAVEAAR